MCLLNIKEGKLSLGPAREEKWNKDLFEYYSCFLLNIFVYLFFRSRWISTRGNKSKALVQCLLHVCTMLICVACLVHLAQVERRNGHSKLEDQPDFDGPIKKAGAVNPAI